MWFCPAAAQGSVEADDCVGHLRFAQNDFIGGVIELALAFEDVEEIAHAAAVAFVGESDGAIVGVNGIDQRTVAHLFV